MIEAEMLNKTLEALRDSLEVLTVMGEWNRNRRFLHALLGRSEHVDKMIDALGAYRSSDPASARRVHTVAERILGEPIQLSTAQILALHRFFTHLHYLPLHDDQVHGALAKMLEPVDHPALRDLQSMVGLYWVGDEQLSRILKELGTFAPGVAWTERHVFALTTLLVIDFDMKTLQPFPANRSIW